MAPQDDFAAVKADFEKHATKIRDTRNEISDGYDDLLKKVNKTIRDLNFIQDWWFDDEVKKIRKVVNVVGDKIKELVKYVNFVLDGTVPVMSLFGAAFEWVDSVQGPAANTVATAREPAVWSVRQWTGDAANAYLEIRSGQALAVQGLSKSAADIGTWLANVAKVNLEFMIDLVKPLIEVAKSVIAAVIAAVTIAGALEAIGKLADACAAALAAMAAVASAAAKKLDNTLEQAVAAERILNDTTAFKAGNWPNHVTI